MKFQSFLPHPALTNYIHFYWEGTLEHFEKLPLEVSIHAITMQNLLFFPKNIPVRIENGISKELSSSTFIGMITKPSTYKLQGLVKIYGVRFKPIGFSKFFKVPASEFTDKAEDLSLVFKLEIDELEDNLFNANSKKVRYDALNKFFLYKLYQSKESNEDKMMQWTLGKLDNSMGQTNIKYTISKLDLSHKQLRRVFLKRTGILPKTYTNILRFGKAYSQIISGKRDWFEIINECGYFDQAHMIKDFKKFTNVSPTVFESDFKDFDNFHR